MEDCSFQYSCRSQPATLVKVTLFQECFPSFLNCTSNTKSRKASHMHQYTVEKSFKVDTVICLRKMILLFRTHAPFYFNASQYSVVSQRNKSTDFQSKPIDRFLNDAVEYCKALKYSGISVQSRLQYARAKTDKDRIGNSPAFAYAYLFRRNSITKINYNGISPQS